MKCWFEAPDGYKCQREMHEAPHRYCLLHLPLEFDYLAEEKVAMFEKEISEGVQDFKGCRLPYIDLRFNKIHSSLDLSHAEIGGTASFSNAIIEGDLIMTGAQIAEDLDLDDVKISGTAILDRLRVGKENISSPDAKIDGSLILSGAKVNGDIYFEDSVIGGFINFDKIRVTSVVDFRNAEIGQFARFYKSRIEGSVLFQNSKIRGVGTRDLTFFHGAVIDGGGYFECATVNNCDFDNIKAPHLSFEEAEFLTLGGQENACRNAKMVSENSGNRRLSDYHFYREMEASRKQKKWYIRYPESLVQYFFGYGVKPLRVVGFWLLLIILFSLTYWGFKGVQNVNSVYQYFYYSFITSVAPGYGEYFPKVGAFQIVSVVEAVLGLFLWSCIIVTFARKFMR